MTRCLEIGPGPNPVHPSWDTLDAVDRPGVTFRAEWGAEPIPADDDTYDLVYASHVLEHVPWFQTRHALRETFRVLKPGGAVEIWVPDFRKIVAGYVESCCRDNWRKHNPAGDPMLWVNGRIFTYGPGANWHRACFDFDWLVKSLETAGFTDCRRLDRPRGTDHGPINLGVRGLKLKG